MELMKWTAFIEQVADLHKWDPEGAKNEMDPPQDGAWDSHLCLMSLIDEARSLRQACGPHPADLARMVDMARAHLDDIETGLQDGTYDPEDNEDVGEKRRALDAMDAYLAGQALAYRHLVVVEGDVEPFVMALSRTKMRSLQRRVLNGRTTPMSRMASTGWKSRAASRTSAPTPAICCCASCIPLLSRTKATTLSGHRASATTTAARVVARNGTMFGIPVAMTSVRFVAR